MKQILFLFTIVCLSSCSSTLRPFTDDVYNKNEWNIEELKSVQFYLSDDIVLWREADASDKRVEGGKIKIVKGSRIEEIVFKRGTPGAYLFSPKYGQFAIGFEEDENRYLMFGPSKKASGRYVLLAKEWDKNRGKITYDGVVWNTPAESAFASLLVDIDKRNNTKVERKEVKGRRAE